MSVCFVLFYVGIIHIINLCVYVCAREHVWARVCMCNFEPYSTGLFGSLNYHQSSHLTFIYFLFYFIILLTVTWNIKLSSLFIWDCKLSLDRLLDIFSYHRHGYLKPGRYSDGLFENLNKLQLHGLFETLLSVLLPETLNIFEKGCLKLYYFFFSLIATFFFENWSTRYLPKRHCGDASKFSKSFFGVGMGSGVERGRGNKCLDKQLLLLVLCLPR